jgi:pimeloyl-ACP methyl ester carboxylesterase
MAGQTPELARAMVTGGAAGVFSDPSGELCALIANMVDDPRPDLKDYRDYLVARYGEANARAMTRSVAAAWGAMIEQRGGDISRERAGEIACPVLLIAREYGPFVPPVLLNALAARLCRVDVVRIEGIGHDAHNANPPRFAEMITQWLAAHAAA